MKNYKMVARLLAAALLCGSLLTAVACGTPAEGDKENTGKETTSTGASTQAPEQENNGEEVRKKYYDTLEKEEFKRDFTIQVLNNRKTEFLVEDYTGDILENSIYERNTVVEDDFGIEIVCQVEEDYLKVNNNIMLQINGGLDEFDAYMGHKYSFTTCAQQNALYDMASIVTMDLTAPYWDQACRENLVMEDRNFMMTGDINPYSMLISACFAFNKDMHAELNLANPFELVDNGNWTLDTMTSMISEVTYDLNGDGTIEHTSDRYGLTTWMMDAPFSLFYGAGGMFITIDEDGLPAVTFEAEEVVNIYEKIYRAIITEESYYVTDSNLYDTTYDVFLEGRALFVDTSLNKISNTFSNMEEEYGILPVPKYDKNQKEHLSFVNGASPFIMICQTEKDTEFVGTILDAMAAYNYDNVTPKMFEIVTKLQTARDPDSSRMVDHIIRNRVYDFGYYVDLNVTNLIKESLNSGKAEIASGMKSYRTSSERAIAKLIQNWSKLS